MEKIKSVFSNSKNWMLGLAVKAKDKIKSFLIKKETVQTSKNDFNSKKIIILYFVFAGLFVTVSLFLPTKQEVTFRETAKEQSKSASQNPDSDKKQPRRRSDRCSRSKGRLPALIRIPPYPGNSRREQLLRWS